MSQNKVKSLFLWTGQGAQFPSMGDYWLPRSNVFADCWHDLHQRYKKISGHDLKKILKDTTAINQTIYTQPALVIFELAMANHLTDKGYIPICDVGHSIGELAACMHNGVMSIDDGLWLVHHRARLMQSCPEGTGMMACLAPLADIAPILLDSSVSVAGVNAPKQTVVSGPLVALETLKSKIRNMKCITLPVSHGFHSAAMLPIKDAFYELANQLTYKTANRPMYANTDAQIRLDFDAEYWVNQLLSPVQFVDCIRNANSEHSFPMIETGPKATLTRLAKKCIDQPNIIEVE